MYNFQNTLNTPYIQRLMMTPKNNTDNLSKIQLTNVYCRPSLNKEETKQYYEELKMTQNQPQSPIQIIMGDLNARTAYTGDRTHNLQGRLMTKNITKYQWSNLNTIYAHGTPTYETKKEGNSIVDMALVPSNQQQLWTNFTVANTHPINKDTHHSIIAESAIPIYYQQNSLHTRYTINYNKHDAYRLQAYTEKITDPIQTEIITIQDRYLTQNKQNPKKSRKHYKFSRTYRWQSTT